MARIDTLGHFLSDVADSIRLKSGKQDLIAPEDFDTEIEDIQTGTEINDGSYLFYGNARIGHYDELMQSLKNLTNIYYMFNGANNLNKPVILTNDMLDTLTNASSFYYLFNNCNNIPSISISCNSTIINTLYYMFYNCRNLVSLSLDIDTSNVTNMQGVFLGCESLPSIDISNFNIDKVTNIQQLFYNCFNLTTITGLSLFSNTTKITSLNQLFYNCRKLPSMDLTVFNMTNVTSVSDCFNGCNSLNSVVLPTDNISKITNANSLFKNCDSLKQVTNFDSFMGEGKINTVTNMFASDSTDTTIEGTLDIDTTSWVLNLNKTSGNVVVNFLRYNKCVRNINLAFLNGMTFTGTNFQEMFCNASSLKSVIIPSINTSSATSLQNLFRGCIRLESITGLNYITTNNATNIRAMFYNCQKLGNVDVSHFDVSKVVGSTSGNGYLESGFGYLFYNCKNMTSINLSTWVANVNVRQMSHAFENCEKLRTIQLPNFSAITGTINTSCLFKNCPLLNNVNLGTLTFERMSTCQELFSGCTSLSSLTHNTTVGVTKNFNAMFKGCTSLQTIDASFVGNVTSSNSGIYVSNMFEDCTNLESVDLSNMVNNSYNPANSQYMFKNCTSLKTITFNHSPGSAIFVNSTYTGYPIELFKNCSSLEVLDLRYAFISGNGQESNNTGTLFDGCTKLRKLDLRGTSLGLCPPNNSSWRNNDSYFRDVGSDNATPTIVYTDTTAKQSNIIRGANQVGKNWSTANVIVAGLDEVVDMT